MSIDTTALKAGFTAATQNLATNLASLTKQNSAKFEGMDVAALAVQILAQTVASANTLSGHTLTELQNVVSGENSDLTTLQAQVDAFIARRDDPHDVTQAQIGLDQLVNQGFATAEEADLGVTNKYISPDLVKAAIDAAVSALTGDAPETMDTIEEIATLLKNDPDVLNRIVVDVSGLISIVDAQALMNTIVVDHKAYADPVFTTKLAQAVSHSDTNIGTLADFLAELADQFKSGFDILVPFEALITTGTATFYGAMPTYGYRNSAQIYPIGRISDTSYANGVVTILNWHSYDKELGLVIQGTELGDTSATAIVVNGVVMPFKRRDVRADGVTLIFDTNGRVVPTAVGFPIAVKVISVVPRTVDLPVFEADITIGVTTAITGNTNTYGYRESSGTYPIGALSKNTLADGSVVPSINWFDHTGDLRFSIKGDHRTAGVPFVMIGDVVLTCTHRHYNPTTITTTFIFAWKETIPTSGTVTVRLFMKASSVVPTYRHETAIDVGSIFLNGLEFRGYRDPSSQGMGAIGNAMFLGQHKIMFAQWNITNKIAMVYFEGNIVNEDIKEIEFGGTRMNKRILADYLSANNLTRFQFDAAGLTMPFSVGEKIYLRF